MKEYPQALPAGSVLAGQYVIEDVLGQGGFGITYVAHDHKSGQKLAIKEYYPDGVVIRENSIHVTVSAGGDRKESFEWGKECFLQEATTLADFIGNENIVRVYNYFEENGTAYFAMEYIQGQSLQSYLKKNGKLSFGEACRILFPVMDALTAVHEKGIVHRDVSPDNIYLTVDDQVKLLDFGAARYSLGDRTQSLSVVLKHGFAPLEQYSRHSRQGPFTDIYALAATFFYALTGTKPPDVVDRVVEDTLVVPSKLGVDIPEDAEKVLVKALAVKSEDRYKSMHFFRGDMEACLEKCENEVKSAFVDVKHPNYQSIFEKDRKVSEQNTQRINVENGEKKNKNTIHHTSGKRIAVVMLIAFVIIIGIIALVVILNKDNSSRGEDVLISKNEITPVPLNTSTPTIAPINKPTEKPTEVPTPRATPTLSENERNNYETELIKAYICISIDDDTSEALIDEIATQYGLTNLGYDHEFEEYHLAVLEDKTEKELDDLVNNIAKNKLVWCVYWDYVE
ncbi:MAG: protein kinase [Lachnospiraceae bacterium]|nr:protein kinase [Lachnospiraceae bacterium]